MADELYRFSSDVAFKRGLTMGRNILIHGQNGCGKTEALRGFERWFNRVRIPVIGPVTQIEAEGDWAGAQQATIPDGCFVHWPAVVRGFKEKEFLTIRHLECDYFATIDDIGAEHDPSGFGQEELYLILSRREFMHTIVTTNISPSRLHERFERRIVSRLFRNFTHISLGDVPDWASVKHRFAA